MDGFQWLEKGVQNVLISSFYTIAFGAILNVDHNAKSFVHQSVMQFICTIEFTFTYHCEKLFDHIKF